MLQHCHSKILAITYTYTHTKQHHDTIKQNEKELCRLFCLLLVSLIHITDIIKFQNLRYSKI